MKKEALPLVAIVGAGWAGAAAALWAKRLDLSPSLWLSEGGQIGGCLHHAHNPFWDRLGLVGPAPTGPQWAKRLERQMAQHALRPQPAHITGLQKPSPKLELGLTVAGQEKVLRARYLVLATGLAPRPWPVGEACPSEGRFWGRSASLGVQRAVGQVVAVVGGGDGAAEAASMLAGVCPEVHWIMRASKPRARQALVDAALACPKVRLHPQSEVLSLEGHPEGGARCVVRGPAGEWALRLGWMVVKLGFAPRLTQFGAALLLDPHGYAVVDGHQRSLSHPRIFVVGDAASPHQASLAAAEGQAATALKTIASECN